MSGRTSTWNRPLAVVVLAVGLALVLLLVQQRWLASSESAPTTAVMAGVAPVEVWDCADVPGAPGGPLLEARFAVEGGRVTEVNAWTYAATGDVTFIGYRAGLVASRETAYSGGDVTWLPPVAVDRVTVRFYDSEARSDAGGGTCEAERGTVSLPPGGTDEPPLPVQEGM
jgi:hypothetical protein